MQLIQLTLISSKVRYMQCERLTTNDEKNIVFKRIITSVALQDFVQLFFFIIYFTCACKIMIIPIFFVAHIYCTFDYSNLIELAVSELITK